MCENAATKCEDDMLFLTCEHERHRNLTLTGLSTYSTEACATVKDDRLVPLYPWVEVSDTGPELALAQAQRRSMTALLAAFPNASSFSITYVVGNDSEYVKIAVDWQSVSFASNVSTVLDVRGNISEDLLRPYAAQEEFLQFLRSRNAALKRWRKVCTEAYRRDVSGGVDMTFVYRPEDATLNCSIRLRVPVFYLSKLECTDPAVPDTVIDGDLDSDLKGETLVWRNPKCNATGVRCVFQSSGSWDLKIFPIVLEDRILERPPANGIGIIISVVVITLVVGLGVYGLYYRYRSSAGSWGRTLCGFLRGCSWWPAVRGGMSRIVE